MKLVRSIGTTLLASVLALVLAISIVGCGGDPNTGIAAKVGDAEILEADVTARIETYRIDQTTGERMEDAAWAKLLEGAGFTPESLRKYVIEQQFAMPLLVLQAAEAAGVSPDSAAVDTQINTQRDALGEGDEGAKAWDNYLKQLGYSSEAAYRQYLEAQNVATGLLAVVAPGTTPSAEKIAEYVTANAASYVSKRSSAIVFAIADEASADETRARAEEVLAKLAADEDFAALASEYSDDTSSKALGGDMGWSVFASLPQEYLTVLSELSIGETSGLVETTGALYIIKCTDEFKANEDGTVDFAAVPEEIITMLTDSLTQSNLASDQQAYFEGLLASDKLVINPMPQGLSYDVDMALASQASTPATEENPSDQPSDQSTNETPSSTGELVITDTQVGTGATAQAGDTVSVHYTGYLTDGTVFDSSYDRGTPIQFTLGAGSVIQGWEQGIPGMLVGGKRQLVIPPNMAYGEAGRDSIPPNATLTFDVELVSID